MVNQKLYIINLNNFFDVINELKEHLDIDIFKYDERKFFLDKFEKKEISLKNSIIIVPEDEYNSFLKYIKEDSLIKFRPPINFFRFLENLNVRFIQKSFQDQSSIKIKNFVLDTNSRTLKKNNKNLKLTEREIDMILFLKNAENPVNIATLEKEIWRYSSELETHTVETHIYRLRKKIKDEFGDDDLILSKKNGYIL